MLATLSPAQLIGVLKQHTMLGKFFHGALALLDAGHGVWLAAAVAPSNPWLAGWRAHAATSASRARLARRPRALATRARGRRAPSSARASGWAAWG